MDSKRNMEKINNVVSFMPDGDYYFNKALKALEKEQYEKAYKYMERASELSPDDAHILLHFGIFEMERQNFEKAYELIHTAYSLEPDEAEHVFFMAEISGYIGLINDAKKYAEYYLEIDPDGSYAENALKILDYIEFEGNIIDNLHEEDSTKIIAQEKARRLMEKGEFHEAIEMLEQLIDQYPSLWPAYNNLALAYFYVGEIEQAKALLNQILRERDGDLHAICNLTVIAYYEKDEEILEKYVEWLKKIVPFEWENRYKLGSTLALVGENTLAFKWLYSMKKQGIENAPGFYFWFAQAAYFSGHSDIAKEAWEILIELDPSKKGLEPWRQLKPINDNSLENNRQFLIKKITSKYAVYRMFGFFLLSKSIYKQDIIAHPKYIDLTKYNSIEKLCLAYALDYQFNLKDPLEKAFYNSMLVTEKLYENRKNISIEDQYLYQMWFVLCERAVQNNYQVKNVNAIAAVVEYLYYSSIEKKVTKKQFATKYHISVPTLTKYLKELLQFLPFDTK